MKTSILISMLVLIGSSLFPLPTLGGETIAVVLKVRGSVTVQKTGEPSTAGATRGFRLEDGHKLVAGEKSFVALRFIDDASLLRLPANSTCTIKGKMEDNRIMKNVFVEVGTVFTTIARQKGTFQVVTPTSVASVKGTKFITQHRLARGTLYFSEDGVIEVSNDAGSAIVKAGETAYVASKEASPVVRKTKPGEIPTLEEDEEVLEEFALEFEDPSGKRKTLTFGVKKEE